MINGLVDREMIFTLDDLKRFPQVNKFYFLECAANGGMEWKVHNLMVVNILLGWFIMFNILELDYLI